MGQFIDRDDERLERRYMETSRRHPLAGECPIVDRIWRERQVGFALRDRADPVIDSSLLTAPDLKRWTSPFALDAGGLRVFVTSFGRSPG
jgi:RNase adapter protein RapZ